MEPSSSFQIVSKAAVRLGRPPCFCLWEYFLTKMDGGKDCVKENHQEAFCQDDFCLCYIENSNFLNFIIIKTIFSYIIIK